MKAIQPTNAATIERMASITSKMRNVFNGRMSFTKRSPTSVIAGMEKRMIGLQAMMEFGNRNGRETITMAVRRTIANEEYAMILYTFMLTSKLEYGFNSDFRWLCLRFFLPQNRITYPFKQLIIPYLYFVVDPLRLILLMYLFHHRKWEDLVMVW